MFEEIIFTNQFFEELKLRFNGIDIPKYKFRKLFSRNFKIFFDCEEKPPNCLEDILHKDTYPRFIVYFIIREENGNLLVMDVSFANPGKETLERFIKRYPTQLKPANTMALQLSGREYVEYLGVSYEDQ